MAVFSNKTNFLRLLKSLEGLHIRRNFSATREFEEIQIPVPWGHLAGKWYGPKNGRPLIGLHGWMDNAGTYDTLAPLLPKDMPFVSLDMPGHGLSSWLPHGIRYHAIEYVAIIERLLDEFKLDKVSLMGHSMSSTNAFVFAALFPQKVDLLIGFDVLKPITRSGDATVDYLADCLEGNLKMEQRMLLKKEPPAYEWQQLMERLHLATNKSVDLESCKYLLERNVHPSDNNPNKYYFSRDSRLKKGFYYTFAQEVSLAMARRITCPHLFIKGRQSSFSESKKYFYEVLEILQQKDNFEYHEMEGTHHVHINEPEKVARVVNAFLKKWKS